MLLFSFHILSSESTAFTAQSSLISWNGCSFVFLIDLSMVVVVVVRQEGGQVSTVFSLHILSPASTAFTGQRVLLLLQRQRFRSTGGDGNFTERERERGERQRIEIMQRGYCGGPSFSW